MAINSTTSGPLRMVGVYTTSGTFIPPAGTTRCFVSILGASGGQGGQRRYRQAGAGGSGVLVSGWVQVTPGHSHVVTIGAGGVAGAYSNVAQNNGTAGGQSSFDYTLIANGGAGSLGANGNAQSNAAAGSGTGETTLPTLNPGATTLVRVSDLVTQTTSAQPGGYVETGGRYTPAANGNGIAGKVYIFI